MSANGGRSRHARYTAGMRFIPAVLLAAALAACSSSKSTAISGDEAQDLLLDRNWLDRMPETDRDHLFVYRFVPSMGGGVFQDRTLYKGVFELFNFEATGDQIRFNLPETKSKVTSGYTIEKVDGPAPFDLKLTIPDDPRGPHVYFGMRSETDQSGMLLEQRLRTR
ncbi:MAG: uncharacterized protein H6Q90_928 [Deltaproteobacteria bacterium]|nr:uncharacterized protein [Deltaproteobacteria bacterium]